MKKLVIIGNGMAGSRFCAEMMARGAGQQFQITIFGDEPGGAYNRILLSDVLNGSREAHAIETHSRDWYETNGIELRAGERIAAIDRQNKVLIGEDGSQTEYDILVLAVGSRALVPPLVGLHDDKGARKSGVFVMRTLSDCANIASYAAKAPSAAVIGGGLLGLEAARGLQEYGAKVHVIHRGAWLLNTQLDAISGDLLRRSIEDLGIEVHLRTETTEVLGDDAVEGLMFSHGKKLECDMLVIACVIVPNTALAQQAGLKVERAICVDDAMRVEGETDIYALGECIQHAGRTYGLVATGWEQARVLAQVLSGQNTEARYYGSKTSTKLKVMGVDMASIGEILESDSDEVVQYMEPQKGVYQKLIIRNNKLAGAILLGDTRKAAVLTQAFDRALPLPEERAGLLFNIGKIVENVNDWPDDTPICNCNGIDAGAIRACIKNGASDLDGVMNQTRAGTGCGSCKSTLKQMLQ